MGQFRLENLKPAKAGKPQIEVKFEVDNREELKVSARDLDTGNIQHITITK